MKTLALTSAGCRAANQRPQALPLKPTAAAVGPALIRLRLDSTLVASKMHNSTACPQKRSCTIVPSLTLLTQSLLTQLCGTPLPEPSVTSFF